MFLGEYIFTRILLKKKLILFLNPVEWKVLHTVQYDGLPEVISVEDTVPLLEIFLSNAL
jgi:hypothetical protein